jgi:hypothetical protein
MRKTIKKLFARKPKPRYSFVGKKHTLKIDDDIWAATSQYIVDQINIMKRHGAAPDPPLSPEEFNDLVYVTAKYPQQLRDLENKK